MKTTARAGAMMSRQFIDNPGASQLPGISLQKLVNQLLSNSMATAFRNKSLVINEVSREVFLSKEKVTVAPVIRALLAAVISNSRNGEIYIGVERFRDIITVQVQDRNNYNGYALSSSLAVVEAEAALIGGNMVISGTQKKVVTISFSFSNQPDSLQCDC